jgi:hypothetical protein
MVYHSYFLPQVLYAMNTTNFNKVQCDSIQSPVVTAILPHLGFNRHTSRSLTFAPAEFGGIGLANLYSELYASRLEMLTMHIRNSQSELEKLFHINLEYIQILIGKSVLYLKYPKIIRYIQATWFSGLHEFLIENELQFEVTSLWCPQHQRLQDKVIMDEEESSCNMRLQVINNWRLFFQVSLLSDIATADGTKICPI